MLSNDLLLRLISSASLNFIEPESMLEIDLGNSPRMDKAVIDLPEPDSPTIPKISFS